MIHLRVFKKLPNCALLGQLASINGTSISLRSVNQNRSPIKMPLQLLERLLNMIQNNLEVFFYCYNLALPDILILICNRTRVGYGTISFRVLVSDPSYTVSTWPIVNGSFVGSVQHRKCSHIPGTPF